MAYLSFPDFMERKRYRFQGRLWEGDPMYRCKLWKAHRQEYARVCRFGKYANDQKLLDEEVMQYERRILEARRNSGMLTEKDSDSFRMNCLCSFPYGEVSVQCLCPACKAGCSTLPS
ncbi:MAG: hypothetical protein ACLRL6_08280 [Clostridium sp.]